MDNKVTKERINSHLEYDWYKYLLLIAAVVFTILFAFSQINMNRTEEKFSLFFTAYGFNNNEYSQKTQQAFKREDYDAQKYGKDILRSIAIEFQTPLTTSFAEYLTARVYTADAMIAPKSFFYDDENDISRAAQGFLPLSPQILEDMGVDDSYELMRIDADGKRVKSGGTVYAVRVDNLSKMSAIAKFNYNDGQTEYESEFFLGVLNYGANAGKIQKKDRAENRQTFFCLKMLFELYGN